jgi:hypothetical protein
MRKGYNLKQEGREDSFIYLFLSKCLQGQMSRCDGDEREVWKDKAEELSGLNKIQIKGETIKLT